MVSRALAPSPWCSPPMRRRQRPGCLETSDLVVEIQQVIAIGEVLSQVGERNGDVAGATKERDLHRRPVIVLGTVEGIRSAEPEHSAFPTMEEVALLGFFAQMIRSKCFEWHIPVCAGTSANT